MNSPADAADARSFFDGRSGSYMRLAKWASDDNLRDASRAMLEGLVPSVVAEFGVGNAVLLSALEFPATTIRIGLDISFGMLRAANGRGIHLVQADVHNPPLRSSSLDMIVCRQILHYCDSARVLEECGRVLRTGGVVHIAQLTDYADVEDAWMDYWVGLRGVSDRRRLTRDRLVSELKAAGLELCREARLALRVEHSWDDFFEKNRVGPDRRDEVRRFFRSAPVDTRDAYDLRVSDGGLAYTRIFTLLLASR